MTDAAGNRTAIALANGDTINYGYDNAYRLTSEVRRDAGGNVIYDDAITYDAVGNRTKRILNGETTSFFYNSNNQLTESAGGTTKRYFYDRNGNQIRVVSPGEVEHYEFDELNRMTEYRKVGGGQPIVEQHQYRGAEWHRFGLSAEGVTTRFLYDGDNVAADVINGAVQRQYVTPFLDQNLSMTDVATARTYYYSHDGLGSVRTLTTAAGQVANKYDYNAWGEAHLPGTVITVPQRYTYTGRESNPISPLMGFRNRMYSMNLGRFGSRDPLGYVDGVGLYNGYFVPNGVDSYGLAEAETQVAGPEGEKKSCCCCCPTELTVRNIKKTTAVDSGFDFDVIADLQYKKVKDQDKAKDCTLEWWEWSDKPAKGPGKKPNEWWDGNARPRRVGPGGPVAGTLANWYKRGKPSPGEESVTLTDTPRYLAIDDASKTLLIAVHIKTGCEDCQDKWVWLTIKWKPKKDPTIDPLIPPGNLPPGSPQPGGQEKWFDPKMPKESNKPESP